MTSIVVPYLLKKRGARGRLSRWYWEPSKKLHAEGYRTKRVPDDWPHYTNEATLATAAISAAQAINKQVTIEREQRALSLSILPTTTRVDDRTISTLIKLYRAHQDFTALRATTRRGYEQCLDRIEAWAGDVSVTVIDAKRVQNLKLGMRSTPAFANAVVRVLRLLLTFAMREAWIHFNPARSPKLFHIEPSGLIWPREAVAAIVAKADVMNRHSIGTAVLLDEWIGQRQGDILRMPRSIWRDGSLTLRQSKGNAGVSLPVDLVKPLVDRLREEFARSAERKIEATTIIVDEKTKQRYTADAFRHAFADIRDALAKDRPSFELDHLMPGRDMDDPNLFTAPTIDLQFMHLRHTAITRLAEAGCSAELISAVSGHSLASIEGILGRYLVRTKATAARAFKMRVAADAAREPEAAAVAKNAGEE